MRTRKRKSPKRLATEAIQTAKQGWQEFATLDLPDTKIRWCTCACWKSPPILQFRFDALQMPLNLMDACERPFILA